jgi:hypothetical protein
MLRTQVKIVLHNFILKDGLNIYVYDDATWLENLPRSTHTHIDVQIDNEQWRSMRDELAQKMWHDQVDDV